MTRRSFLSLAAAGPFVLRHRIADAAVDPALVGSWSPRVKLPNIPIHVASLPATTETFFLFSKVSNGCKAWTYDWATRQIVDCTQTVSPNYNPMCGGGFLDDDGRLRFYGGFAAAEQTVTYNPYTRTWRSGPKLTKAAYYPTALRTGTSPGYPRGAVLVGTGKRIFTDIRDAEDYTAPFSQLPASANLPDLRAQLQYPRWQLLPDGSIFMGGTEQLMQRLDMATYRWTPIGNMLYGRRFEGCCTPIPGSGGYEFLLSGGDPSIVSKTMERINLAEGTPVSRPAVPMKLSRRQHNSVILPDGTILLLGGMGTPTPNAPECYDPLTDTTRLMADTLPGYDKPGYRAYHSCAELLDDGRVIWAGGVAGSPGLSFEVFTPPYLYHGPRPAFVLVDTTMAYGGLAQFTSADPSSIHQIVLMRPSHVSHGLNVEQQHLPCVTIPLPTGGQIVLPTNPNLAPPGWYRVFALSAAGVPSLAQWIRLTF